MKEKDKIKVYLDTNIIYGYFLTKALETKKGKKFKLPKVTKFLSENKDKVEYYISTLTENEIIRHFNSEFDISPQLVRKWLNEIKQLLGISKLDINISFEEICKDIQEIVSNTKIRKRVTNLEHLVIAKKTNLVFLTGDEEIRRKCKQYYPNIINYKEFRNMLTHLNTSENNKNYGKFEIRDLGERICKKEQKNADKNSADFRKNEKEGSLKIQRNYENSLLDKVSHLMYFHFSKLNEGRWYYEA